MIDQNEGPRLNKYGVPIGSQVPLNIANRIARERDMKSRNLAREAGQAAGEAVEEVLTVEEKPRSGRRARKNLRPNVEAPTDGEG